MTSIQDLFSDTERERATGSARDRVADEQRLSALVGASRAMPAPLAIVDDTPALQRLVGSRGAVVEATGAVRSPSRVRRGAAARDWLSIGTAVLAVLALAAAAVVAGVSIASSSPEKSALENLTDAEGRLVDVRESVNRSIAAASALQAEIVASAEGLPNALNVLAGVSDETLRKATDAARAEVVKKVQDTDIPSPFAPYRRGAVDVSSLVEIGAAIDRVGELQLDVEPIATEVSTDTRALNDADERLTNALAAFVSAVPGSAAGFVAEAPDVDESFQTATMDAAAALASSDLRSSAGQAAAVAYAESVTALREEQARIVEAQRRAAITPPVQYGTGGGTSSEVDTGSEQTADPEPAPDPDPVPTEPVEPEPTTPSVPDPTESPAA